MFSLKNLALKGLILLYHVFFAAIGLYNVPVARMGSEGVVSRRSLLIIYKNILRVQIATKFEKICNISACHLQALVTKACGKKAEILHIISNFVPK